ncbi:GTP-binding protein [Serratia sp. M24T3]|uniref:CobW family GTP-binding protein n=1 Tax=Serratia sp. M24T3 TaxID=932213 RepID=UPI00025BB6B5|nr:GTP-binding protein [Serratia sp. M24T3]EIC82869.1 cobalamin synthesis protein P47K [Serratia sp. M24T3]
MTQTNLITGFLGSGKTTTIRHLLAQKPENEKWAVLVNEFGEIGIDGALLADSGAVLKEIPGGCMCCVNGLPMQVGLNMLLQKAKPDRLLIEPTGLGHPKQILSLLTSEVYHSWLTLNASLCLLDARLLSDERTFNNENFRDQLAAADIVIANKVDTYTENDNQKLAEWIATQNPALRIERVSQGQIDASLLDELRLNQRELPDGKHHHAHASKQGLAALSLQGLQRWRRALNEAGEYSSCGWIFDTETVFDTAGILDWARQAPVDRVKAVVRIKEGTLRVNRQGNDLHIETLGAAPVDSRIELISRNKCDWNTLQSLLLKIRLS